MHKQNLIKEHKLKFTKLEIFLLNEMGIFSNLKRKNVKNTNETFFKNITIQKKRSIAPKENLVNLHLDTVEKVDELITKNEPEINNRNPKPTINSKIEPSLSKSVEIREPIARSQEVSNFNSEITPNDSLGELNKVEEFCEIQPPKNDSLENQKVKEDDFQSIVKVDKEKESKKLLLNFLNIKVRRRSKDRNNFETTSNNKFTRTKDELERTKEEIEAKRRELEMIEQREKEREVENKKKEEEKREQDKLELIEIQKQKKEVKHREKESNKIEMKREKERQLELKKMKQEKREQEKLRQLELKKKMKEDKFKEKELKKIEMEREKERQLELKKMEEQKLREIELNKKMEEEKLREKIEAEKEMEKQLELKKMEEQKLREIELNKKMEEEKLRQKIEAKKEMEKQLELQKIEEQNKEKEGFQPLKTKEEEKEHIPKDKFEKDSEEPPMGWDEDVEKLIPIIDSLLEKLPDEVIDEFAKSENFTLYEKVILKYKNK